MTNTLLKIHITTESAIAIKIHNTMLNSIPASPSPTSMPPPVLKLEETSGCPTPLNRSTIFPRLSLSLTPLYRPIVMNRKNAIDKMVVEMIEFSKKVLCLPSPQK